MCGHVFMYHDSYSLQRHRPVWQCGTCGRVSSAPLDCCTRPDFAQPSPAALTRLLGQWVRAFGRWARARVRPLWRWQRHPATRAATLPPTTSPTGVVTEGVMVPTVGHDESPEVEEVVMAAGERL